MSDLTAQLNAGGSFRVGTDDLGELPRILEVTSVLLPRLQLAFIPITQTVSSDLNFFPLRIYDCWPVSHSLQFASFSSNINSLDGTSLSRTPC